MAAAVTERHRPLGALLLATSRGFLSTSPWSAGRWRRIWAGGDLTSDANLPTDLMAEARVVARAAGRLASLRHVRLVGKKMGRDGATPPYPSKFSLNRLVAQDEAGVAEQIAVERRQMRAAKQALVLVVGSDQSLRRRLRGSVAHP